MMNFIKIKVEGLLCLFKVPEYCYVENRDKDYDCKFYSFLHCEMFDKNLIGKNGRVKRCSDCVAASIWED